eukprot:TRINITY_DN40897_c0_g1_i1.p1 TRINITY_DN40897_c0_g1~~TRINITY_DN40897_c0_g1_i1.p1  ORF type:complete len:326 (-),score=40.85 TRINITY_DN40897_c0_g1_i1:119-1030(-)
MENKNKMISVAGASFIGGFMLGKFLAERSRHKKEVRPTRSWPKKYAFTLSEGARNTQFTKMGPVAREIHAKAKSDLDYIRSIEAGFAFMIDNFHQLVERHEYHQLDVSKHPLQPDIKLEDVKYHVINNGDGTKDVIYISLHVCTLEWAKMMDVYFDERLTMDCPARGDYQAKVHYEEDDGSHKRIYHTLVKNVNCNGLDRSDLLQYCEKFKHTAPCGNGEAAVMVTVDSAGAPPGTWVHRDQLTHTAGSSMFPHKTPGWSNIFCVRDQRIPADADIYETLIKPMSFATEQQILYGRENSLAQR